MSKAEEFIKNHTNNQANISIEISNGGKMRSYSQPWLTPDQARRAVEIAREEIYEWLANHYRDYIHNPTGEKSVAFFGGDMISDLEVAMKDET